MTFASRQYSIEELLSSTKILGCCFSADEKHILFSSNQSGIFNAYSMPITGGDARQLTWSTASQTYGLSFFPGDSRVLLSHDREGNENYHHYVLQSDGSETDITLGENVRANYYRETADRQYFYSSTNQRDPCLFDIYKTNFTTLEREMIFQDMVGYQFAHISPDERYLAFIKPNTREDSDIYIYDLQTKEMSHITPHVGPVLFKCALFDVDARFLYYITNEAREFEYAKRYELTTRNSEIFEVYPWDITYISFSAKGKYRVISCNENARTVLRIYEHQTNMLIDLPTFPDGDIISAKISPSERIVALYVNGGRYPDTLYMYDFTTRESRKLIGGLAPNVSTADLVEPEQISYHASDGLEIPCLFWKPYEVGAQRKIPALVYVHGGPGGQIRKKYSELVQYLVNHGYAVLAPNYRGSSGYGKTYKAADNRRHGREPLSDCVAAKKYLASLGYIDMSKVGIIGGSYGGYMVLAALAFQPLEFAAGVDMFGTSNWARTIESFAPYWKANLKGLYEKIGDPSADREALRAISPLFHAQNIVKPLLVLHSENDPRVRRCESDDLVDAIKKNNGTVEYLLFAQEGHGLAKRENKICAFERILSFLDRHLKRGDDSGEKALSAGQG
jgi:dipeptidyl aminopeptidase/acylaminoacyl peptidase